MFALGMMCRVLSAKRSQNNDTHNDDDEEDKTSDQPRGLFVATTCHDKVSWGKGS